MILLLNRSPAPTIFIGCPTNKKYIGVPYRDFVYTVHNLGLTDISNMATE